MKDTYITRAQLAKELKLNIKTITKYSQSGMPTEWEHPRKALFPRAACLAWCQKHRKAKSMKNIYRYDKIGSSTFRGYKVHIHRNGQTLTKYFSDYTYGGEDSALDAAQTFRDEALAHIADDPNYIKNYNPKSK